MARARTATAVEVYMLLRAEAVAARLDQEILKQRHAPRNARVSRCVAFTAALVRKIVVVCSGSLVRKPMRCAQAKARSSSRT